MAIFMNNKKIAFYGVLVAAIAGIGVFCFAKIVKKNKLPDTEQVAVATNGVVLFSDNNQVTDVSVDADKSQHGANDNSIQMWIK